MRSPWSLLLVTCCTGALVAVNPYESDREVWKAVELLKSMGVMNLCHPDLDGPVLPRCNEDSSLRPARSLGQEDGARDKSSWYIAGNIIGAVVCVLVGGLAAGLTVGLLSLDPLVLLIKMRAAEKEEERQQAARLVGIVKRRHLLLVSLILCTAITSEALPIFLQDLMPDYAAVLVSVLLVISVGEILPSAIFTGSNQLALASRLAPIVKIIMCILYLIAAPIAKLLDRLLKEGDAGNMYNRG